MQARPQETSTQEAAVATFVRMPSVIRQTGLGRSTIYRLIAHEKFPRPRRIGERAVGWCQSDLDSWHEARPTSR